MTKSVVAAMLVAFTGACQSEKIDLTMIVDPGGPVSFAQDLQPLFTASCGGANCHIGRATSGVNLSNHASVTTSVGLQYNRLVVQPGDGAGSPLIDKLGPGPEFGQRMPFGRSPLSTQDIAMIRQWIDEGAQNN